MAKDNKDKGLRLVVGVILLLIGLSGFGMTSMMGGWYMGYAGFNFYWYIISLGIIMLGAYLIYSGLKE